MGAYAKRFTLTHLKNWDIYLTVALTMYILYFIYFAYMWAMGTFYNDAGVPIIEQTSTVFWKLVLVGVILSLFDLSN